MRIDCGPKTIVVFSPIERFDTGKSVLRSRYCFTVNEWKNFGSSTLHPARAGVTLVGSPPHELKNKTKKYDSGKPSFEVGKFLNAKKNQTHTL